ncbi:hypothetical protein CPC08DRAFT_793695 [Agrocybe pediades]|nr:hypothetical protein CPC08DRAFT_793695 [Agrocybe pediades]
MARASSKSSPKVTKPSNKGTKSTPRKIRSYSEQMRDALEAQGSTHWNFLPLFATIETYIHQTMVRLKYPVPPHGVPLDLFCLHPIINPRRPNYLLLILLAIWGSEEKQLTLQQIYDAIEDRFQNGMAKKKKFQDSLRHKLSHEKELFYNIKPLAGSLPKKTCRKRKTREEKIARGSPWTINPFYMYSLDPCYLFKGHHLSPLPLYLMESPLPLKMKSLKYNQSIVNIRKISFLVSACSSAKEAVPVALNQDRLQRGRVGHCDSLTCVASTGATRELKLGRLEVGSSVPELKAMMHEEAGMTESRLSRPKERKP